MGRKTFDSIGKPLPGRENFVLSRSKPPVILSEAKNLRLFNSLEEALRNIKTEKAFIIGGGELFAETMEDIDGIYLTQIKGNYEGDIFYPEIPARFKEVSREPCPEDPKLEFLFHERK